jgi:hypothetical protein
MAERARLGLVVGPLADRQTLHSRSGGSAPPTVAGSTSRGRGDGDGWVAGRALRSASRSLDRRVAATPAGRDRTVDLTGSIAVLAAAFQACYFTAVGPTSVSLATLVAIGVAPVVVITVETVRGRAPPGSGTTLVLALVGLALLAGVPQGGHDPLAVLAGTASAALAGTASP